ncbi:DoxX family protein [Gilvimarinus agarilyticus]|uniref:DoxX-like family protein n=1 Tax=Reichenbachiella agariperforans TaxID=156994 RepID=A0A1M6R2J0_REIAG|nr:MULTISPECIES: DoxX family protein [Reichenbachiella]MBU2884181.1 DoxX family protein [Gilvimarinus agarilyticus]MBU2912795.1 DoxX family protein [Reichenbachiella agariperforans]RJE70690.1 DoxX family protein [Reichenbachiella sp. MSK19-1]SHK26721.1 DoxX-like family protein [Reichenbachiella agariperforans]
MKSKILLVLTVLFGLMMVNSGLNKFLNYMPMPEMSEEQMALFGAFAKIGWLFPLVGFIEVVGGILIAIPKLRALGAIVILPVMVGIVIHHIVHDPSTLVVVLVMLAINLWAILDNKDKYMPMIS